MIHLIGNAHLDPAWMWPLEEGLEAFAATCRSALDRIREYPDLIFTCSSAAHYEYVGQTDPALFKRIQEAVSAGSWFVVGGWWVEADCNLPSGEALIRQALLGQQYFQSRFGKIATVGYNVDSFGHNANMPALLAGAGLTSYIFMRPEQHERALADALLNWRSPSGVSIETYRLPLHYSNHQQDIRAKLQHLPEYLLYRAGRDWMLFFGVGNHGGGPTIEQLEAIRAEQEKREDLQLSDPDKFFASVKSSESFVGELNPHAIGAYSANARIKQLNRRAERALDRAERMDVMRSRVLPEFGSVDLQHAWNDLCLTQFHDLLGGVSTLAASDEAIALQQKAIATAEGSSRLDRQRIASQIDTSSAIQNLVVFNDSALDREEYIEFELWHPHASEKGEILHSVMLVDSEGRRIPCQKIEPSGKIGEDRVRFLSRVRVPSLGWRTFAIHEGERSDDFGDRAESPDPFAKLLVSRDQGDTWAHGITTYLPTHSEFVMHRAVVTESGPLRAGIRSHLQFARSVAEIEHLKYASEGFTELRVMLDWHEPDENVLLAIPHGISNPAVRYEIQYATIDRDADGEEYPGQTWLDVYDTKTGQGVALINDSKYSFSVDEKNIYVTLARSKPYAYHVPPHDLKSTERTRYLDHAIQECRFLVFRHESAVKSSDLYRLSERLNSPLSVHNESSHSGTLPHMQSLLLCSNESVRVGAIKRAEQGEDIVIRLIEMNGGSETFRLSGSAECEDRLSPYEIKTVKGEECAPVDFLERPL